MEHPSFPIAERLDLLGLGNEGVPLDRWTSAIAALACFPMYMVANVHAWTGIEQFKLPLVNIPGFEALRESVEIGRQEALMPLSPEHAAILDSMLMSPRAPDRVIYEFALTILKGFLTIADPAIAREVRTAVARMVVAVAKASGEGLLGGGPKVSEQERKCIQHIAVTLMLSESPEAAGYLAALRTD
jgi:hypothetical protein